MNTSAYLMKNLEIIQYILKNFRILKELLRILMFLRLNNYYNNSNIAEVNYF